MQQLEPAERTLVSVMKDIPLLPAEFRKWLATNAWWLVIIGVALSAFSVISNLVTLSSPTAAWLDYMSAYVGSSWKTNLIIGMVVTAVVAVIDAMAISPLKAMQKKGWSLLLLALIVGIVGVVVQAVVTGSLTLILAALIGLFVGAYVLYQVREYYK